MSQSALQLERYFFSKVSIEASKQIKAQPKMDAATRLEAARNNKDRNRFLLSLTVTLTAPQDTPAPYCGEVQVIGFFRIHPDLPPDQQDKLIAVTGASILYGVAREMIVNVTSRGPWPAVTLPCVNFNDPGTTTPEQVETKQPAAARA